MGMCENCLIRRFCGKPVCRPVGKARPFPWAVNGFSIGTSGSFPYFHDAICYPRMSRYAVSGTYHTATINRHARTKPPITPPIMKLNTNSAIL
ncbi:MAG: hypothetical protein IJ274_15565, partial [Lachnospiraceae bacterium]|nr:hypothetical protein [Lachnospiraceae bacterium]